VYCACQNQFIRLSPKGKDDLLNEQFQKGKDFYSMNLVDYYIYIHDEAYVSFMALFHLVQTLFSIYGLV
jgi:hypothetical protein